MDGISSRNHFYELESQHQKSAMVRMTGVIYGLTLFSLAIVFSVSSAVQKVQNHYHDGITSPMYLEVFQLYMYGVSLFCLAYLQAFILCHRPKLNKEEKKITFGLHAIDGGGKKDELEERDETTNNNSPQLPRTAVVTQSETLLGRKQKRELIGPGIAYEAEGANFYLRIAAIIFGSGSMILNGFQLARLQHNGRLTFDCFGIGDTLVTSFQMTFTFFQVFYLFKLHKIVIRIQKGFFRVTFVHLIVTNMSTWIVSVVQQIVSNVITHIDVKDMASGNTTTNAVECDSMNDLSKKAAPFLHPCSVQYTLIAGMLTYKIYRQMNYLPIKLKEEYFGAEVEEQHVERGELSTSSSSSVGTNRSRVMPSVNCDKAHKGLFLGLLVLVITVVSISCYFVFITSESSKFYAIFMFFILEYFLLLLASLATLAGIFKFRKLACVPNSTARNFMAEKVLLVLSYPGLVLLKGFYIVALAAELSQHFKEQTTHTMESTIENSTNAEFPADPKFTVEVLAFCSSGAVLLHGILQTRFIIDALNKEISTARHRAIKPGRALVTFLFLCNVSLFLISLFENDRMEMNHHDTVLFYNKTSWCIITNVNVPLLVFFRFLSVICLSSIWRSAYFPKG